MTKSLKKPKPLVSFLVVNWKSQEVTAECIASIRSIETHHTFEIIIFDNEPSNESYRLLKQLPGVKVLSSQNNLGFGGALNQAATQARGKYLAFINNDAVIPSDWMDKALENITKQPNIKAVGGVEYFWDGKTKKKTKFYSIPFVSPKSLLVNQSQQIKESQLVPYVTASNMLVSREVFEKIGGFDTDFFLYYEDMDLCAKIINAGYSIAFIKDLYIWHRINYSSNISGKKYSYIFRNRYRIFAKYYPESKWRLRVATNGLSDMCVSLPLIAISFILSIYEPKYKEKTHIHIEKIKSGLWAITNVAKLQEIRHKHIDQFGYSNYFYQTIKEQAT